MGSIARATDARNIADTLGGFIGRHAAALLRWGDARDVFRRATIEGTRDQRNAAELVECDTLGDVVAIEQDAALEWLFGARMAMKHYPDLARVRFAQLLGTHGDAVERIVNLEREVSRHTDAISGTMGVARC